MPWKGTQLNVNTFPDNAIMLLKSVLNSHVSLGQSFSDYSHHNNCACVQTRRQLADSFFPVMLDGLQNHRDPMSHFDQWVKLTRNRVFT